MCVCVQSLNEIMNKTFENTHRRRCSVTQVHNEHKDDDDELIARMNNICCCTGGRKMLSAVLVYRNLLLLQNNLINTSYENLFILLWFNLLQLRPPNGWYHIIEGPCVTCRRKPFSQTYNIGHSGGNERHLFGIDQDTVV